MSLRKNELIDKLKEISVLFENAFKIRRELANYEPDDNYERSVTVPRFPGEFDDEVREELENSIDHADEDAVDQAVEIFEDSFRPKQPKAPIFGNKPENETENVKELKQKLGFLPFVGIFVAFCALISGGLSSDDSITKIVNILVIIAGLIATAYYYFKLTNAKKADDQATDKKIQEYEADKAQKTKAYEQAMAEYRSSLDSYNLQKADFIEEYSAWRKIYVEHLAEEAEIKAKLEADKKAGIKEITDSKLIPAVDAMNAANDLLPMDYLPIIPKLIDLLENNRADDLKEAINLYEEMEFRERQLEFEREKENRRRYEEEMRRADEERRHKEEMEQREYQERRQRREEERRREMEERKQKEETARREQQELSRQLQERERKRREELKEAQLKREKERELANAASAQCRACIHAGHCNMQFHNKTPNCSGFRPR